MELCGFWGEGTNRMKVSFNRRNSTPNLKEVDVLVAEMAETGGTQSIESRQESVSPRV